MNSKTVAAAVLVGMGAAKDVQLQNSDFRRIHTPNVGLGPNDDLCLFENNDDWWCFKVTPPMAKIGWRWEQVYDSTSSSEDPVIEYYQVKLEPYATAQANFISELYIQNLYINQLTAEVAEFTLSTDLSYIFTEDYQMCFGMVWGYDLIDLAISMTMKFWNCSKTLVDDLTDFSSTWRGIEAKYLDDCSQSGESPFKIYEKEIKEALEDKPIWGTIDPKSERCFGFLGLQPDRASYVEQNDATTLLGKMAYKTLFNYWKQHHTDYFAAAGGSH